MGDDLNPIDVINAIIADFPDHKKGTRPVHVNGVGVLGHFRASDAAAAYCSAEIFNGSDIRATVRFSNGSGDFRRNDSLIDVRGMATRFHLGEDRACDLIAMTLGEFFAATPDEFMAFTKESKPEAARGESAWQKLCDMLKLELPLPDPRPGQKYDTALGALNYANRHAFARQAVADTSVIGAPVSYARAAYHAVNTFIAIAPDGHRHHVRFDWQPVAGVRKAGPNETRAAYLNEELGARVQHWPARFILNMIIGEDGDPLHDPSKPWPRRRKKISMGTLYLTDVPDDPDQKEFLATKISFNPGRLLPGLEMSPLDPILELRKRVYERSRELRGGASCPFSGGSADE